MMTLRKDFRPNCEKILRNYKTWAICLCEIMNNSKFEEIRDKIPKTDSIEKNFISILLK